MIITELIKDRDAARTSKDATRRDFLSTLIGECQKDNKEPSDKECIAVIRKFLKGCNEMIELTYDDAVRTSSLNKARYEKKMLEFYLPAQLSESDIREIFAEEVLAATGEVTLKSCMAYLRESYEGMYSGGVASQIAKEVCR